VLALAAAVLGLVVAQTTVRYAWARASLITGDSLPFWVDLKLEPATIAYALLLALVAAALIGLLPALKATRASVQRGLQGITSTGGTMKFGGVWSFIVGAQVAFTLLFVLGAVAIYANSGEKEQWPAFPAERYLTFSFKMDNEALAGEGGAPDAGQIGARRARAYDELAARLREEPGVMDVTYGDQLPTMAPDWVALEMEQDGAPPSRLQGNFEGGFAMAAVGAGYHDAFGRKVVAGRGLQAADAGAPNGPVVVNEAFVRVVGRNPVGAHVRTLQRGSERGLGPWHEIVGVVTDLPMLFPADWGGAAYIYRAASTAELDPVAVAVRVAGDAAPLVPRAAALARQVDPGLQLRELVTLEAIVAERRAPKVVALYVFGSILFVAVVFSAAGLYALMAVAVSRRTREIGIRIALGATHRHVLRSVFARAGRQLGGGIIAGNSIILFFAWRSDSLTADLFVMSVITSVIMAVVGVLACAAPARRALRVQPTEALRQV
jgi:putative ABC transport system permease protein